MLPRKSQRFLSHTLPCFTGNCHLASFKDPPITGVAGLSDHSCLPESAPFVLPREVGKHCQYDPGTLGVLWAWMASLRQHSGRCCF